MIDFNREPTPKSADETLFDELNEAYTEKFGKPYVFAIGLDADSWDEALSDIRHRIASGEPQPEPDYEPGNDY